MNENEFPNLDNLNIINSTEENDNLDISILILNDEYSCIFEDTQIEYAGFLEYFIKELIKKHSIHHTKNEIYSEISKKLQKRLKDRLLTGNFLNFTIGKCIKEEYNPEEIINEITFLHNLKKGLDYYSTKTIKDLMLRNLKEQKSLIKSDKLLHHYFEYKKIKDFGTIDYEKLKFLLEGPKQLRRPLDEEYGYYRYLPIPCKEYCDQNFSNFLKYFQNTRKEKFEEFIKNKVLTLQLKCIFLKNCIFSHNFNEINYHPFKYMSKYCKNKNCSYDECIFAHRNKNEEIVIFYNPEEMKGIVENLKEIIYKMVNNTQIDHMHKIKKEMLSNSNTTTSSTFLSLLNYKTIECKNRNLCTNMKNCTEYHSILEKRRKPRTDILCSDSNKPCPKAFEDNKWVNPNKCEKSNQCEFFHTRNELFYDPRNFRKIYDCPLESAEGECQLSNYCPYKHASDIYINELYLPQKCRDEIRELAGQYQLYIRESEKLMKEISDKKLICLNCNSFIIEKMIVFKCGHNCCKNCISKLKDCIYRCQNNINNPKGLINYDELELIKRDNNENQSNYFKISNDDNELSFYSNDEDKIEGNEEDFFELVNMSIDEKK